MKSLLFFVIGIAVGIAYLTSGAAALINPLLLIAAGIGGTIFFLTKGFRGKDATLAANHKAWGFGIMGLTLSVIVPVVLLFMAFSQM